MRSLALVLLACTGCDLLFDIHKIELTPDARAVDAAPDRDANMAGGPCSPMSMLADDFSNDDLKIVWPQTAALASNQIAVSNGRLLMSNLSSNSFATLDPGRYYDLRGSYFSASITDDNMLDSGDYVLLQLDSEIAGYGVLISHDNTTMTINELTPSQPPVALVSFAYVPAKHAYLRAGVIGGALVVETSGDGAQWSGAAQIPNATGFTFVHPWIQTHRGSSSPAFTVFVDDVNGGTPSGVACSITQLRDDFSGAALGPAWARSPHTGGALAVTGGVADVTTTGSGSLVVLGASTVYDVRDSAFSVEIPVVIANASQNTVAMSVTTGTGDKITISETNGIVTTAVTLVNTGGQMASVAPFDPVAMRWWRIQNSAGDTGWAFSPDGVTWTALPLKVQVGGMDRSDVGFAVLSTSGTAGDTQFDNVNVHP